MFHLLHSKRLDLLPNLFTKRFNPTFRPLYDSYLDITDAHLDAAIEYILMIPEFNSALGRLLLPVLVGQRTVSLLREGNPLDSERVIKVTRDEMKSYFKKILKAMLVPGGVKRLLVKIRVYEINASNSFFASGHSSDSINSVRAKPAKN